jgi:hypothetical protein
MIILQSFIDYPMIISLSYPHLIIALQSSYFHLMIMLKLVLIVLYKHALIIFLSSYEHFVIMRSKDHRIIWQ